MREILFEQIDPALEMKRTVNHLARIGKIAPHHRYALVFSSHSVNKSGNDWFFESPKSDGELQEMGATGSHAMGEVREGESMSIDGLAGTHTDKDADVIIGQGDGLGIKIQRTA